MLSKLKSSESKEAQLVHEVWERRQSLFPLLAARDQNRSGAAAGDRECALKYAASCVALIAHKIFREAQEKEVHFFLMSGTFENDFF